MQELTKQERKEYNRQVRHHNERVRQSNFSFGVLAGLCFFGACMLPVDTGKYLFGLSIIFAIGAWITSKMTHD